MHRPRSRRGLGAALALLGSVSLIAGCSSSGGGGGGSKTPSSSAPATNAAALGTPHKATGSPLKIGFVNDGKGDTADTTGSWDTANATAKYANEYLNGINGHVIVLDHCETNYTSSGGTACGVQMVKDKTVAVLAPASSEDKLVAGAMSGSGIPVIALSSASPELTSAPGNFVITNGFAALGIMLKTAKEKGIKKAGVVIVDVAAAAAVGPLTKPVFKNNGIEQDFIQIGASVADHTGRIQQAITGGTGAFTISGPESFVEADLKALRQLQFKGPIYIALNPVPAGFSSIPGGLTGITNVVTVTTDPSDPDVKIYNAVKSKYGVDAVGLNPNTGFQSVLSLVRALNGRTTAVDAKSITTAMNTMPAPVKLPLGGGLTFQCGQNLLKVLPNTCMTAALVAELDAKGNAKSYVVVDPKANLVGL